MDRSEHRRGRTQPRLDKPLPPIETHHTQLPDTKGRSGKICPTQGKEVIRGFIGILHVQLPAPYQPKFVTL